MKIDPETLRLVVQFFNHYTTLGPYIRMEKPRFYSFGYRWMNKYGALVE
jgi:hypothetical protein